TPAGSTPTSSAASRSAAPTGPLSEGSIAPPGKAGWPACRRRCGPRCTISRSGSPAVSPNSSKTAEARPPRSGARSRGGTTIRPASAAGPVGQAGAGAAGAGPPPTALADAGPASTAPAGAGPGDGPPGNGSPAGAPAEDSPGGTAPPGAAPDGSGVTR